MSVIGPRPGLWNQDILTAERDKYNANDVKPGLTGLAQINGRDELEIPEKARLDGEYVSKMGLMMDLKCFLGSIGVFAHDDSVVEGGTGEMKKNAQETDEKKKILVICQYYKPEPFRISDICEEMVRRGHEVQVVTGYPNYPEGILYEGYGKGKHIDEVINGVKVHRCFTIPRETGIVKRMENYYSYAISSVKYVISDKCVASDALFQWTTKECYRLKVKNMKILLEIMSAIGCIIIALELSKINGFEELRSYIFFFVLGIIWFRIKDKISKEIIKMISGMSLVVFIGLCIAFFEISNLMVHKIINKLLGLVGTIVISGCVKCIINKNRDWKCWKYIAKIGKNTLPIYAIHWCLLFSTNTFPYSNIAGEVHSIYILSIVVWLEWTIISIFLAKIFEKNKYSRILLLGLK